jgi:DNA polymerase bacteriophage-type
MRDWELSVEELEVLGFPADAVAYAEPTPDFPEALAESIERGAFLVGQNSASFDQLIWEELGYPAAPWVDTMPRFSRRGLPRGLDHVGQLLMGVGKDPLGYKLMRLLSEPQRKGPLKGRFVQPDSARLSRVAKYCLRDVLLTAALWFDEGLGKPDPDDPILRIHEAINARGVHVDIEAARRLRLEDQRQQAEAMQKALEATGGVATRKFLNSPVQIQRWLQRKGISVVDGTRETLERLLANKDLPADARAMIYGRLAVSRITGSKIDALLSHACPDSRLRDMFVYYGAHTGRWSGRGMQVQNLKTPGVKMTVLEDVYDHPDQAPAVAVEEEVETADVLGWMLRGLFDSPPGCEGLGIIDYSSVEARTTKWVAGDEQGCLAYAADDADKVRWEEEKHRTGADPAWKPLDAYIREAAKAFGIPPQSVTKPQRQAGKVAVLACGYQGGPNALTKMADKMGIDLAAAGISAEQMVEAWRDANPLVAGLPKGTWTTPEGRTVITRTGGVWRDVAAVVQDIAKGWSNSGEAAKCLWYRDGKHLVCQLPSGRLVIYRDVAWEDAPTKWGSTAPSVTYLSARGYRTATYGGKLVENVVQAVDRDLLAHAALLIEEAGIPVVLHVHDELVFECWRGRRDYEVARQAILTVPSWAAGLPIFAEGTMSRRYCKP